MKMSQFSGKPALLLFLSKETRCDFDLNFLGLKGSVRWFKASVELPEEQTAVGMTALPYLNRELLAVEASSP
jgi:hypothetical protein